MSKQFLVKVRHEQVVEDGYEIKNRAEVTFNTDASY